MSRAKYGPDHRDIDDRTWLDWLQTQVEPEERHRQAGADPSRQWKSTQREEGRQ
jgi:hypothetical protein